MENRTLQFRVGLMLIGTFVIACILVALLTDSTMLGKETYTVQMRFSDASGISRDTPIRKSGLLVGRVVNVSLDPDGYVSVLAALDSNVELDRSEEPIIHRTLLGDAEVQFRPVQQLTLAQRTPLGPNDVLEGRVQADPLRSLEQLQIQETLDSLRGAGEEVRVLAKNLNVLFADNNDQFTRIIQRTEDSIVQFQATMRHIDEIIGDEQLKGDLRKSIAGLPQLLEETNTTIRNIQNVANSADRNLANLEQLTKPLGERGEQIVTNIDSSIGRLDGLLAQLNEFGVALNSEEGSLGQLLHNPEVYQQLNEAALNINRLTRDLEPILADIRVFTDKVARHPEVLGARGAIRPSTGIK